MPKVDIDEDSKEVLDSLDILKNHGTGTLVVEVRDHVIAGIDETRNKRRGKEFAKKIAN